MTEGMPKGWYKDPYNPTQEIWWDGSNWHPDARRQIASDYFTTIDSNQEILSVIRCSNCFESVESTDTYCNKCGVPVSQQQIENNELWNTEDVYKNEDNNFKESRLKTTIYKFLAWAFLGLLGYGFNSFILNADLTERDIDGNIASSGLVASTKLRVGDCYSDNVSTTVIGFVSATPCQESHDFEVYAIKETKLAEWDEKALEAEAIKFCEKQFPQERFDFLYNNANQDLKSKIEKLFEKFTYFHPSYEEDPDVDGTWESGDRAIMCAFGEEGLGLRGKFL